LDFFKDKSNVEEYINMAAGYDGRELIQILKSVLKKGASLLEIGMGPGVDLDILKEDFKVTGSDYSEIFLDKYRERCPDADLLCLDAINLETERSFDALYSNKVLHHLQKEELEKSLNRQISLLNEKGILCHSFWRGNKQEEMRGLFFQYYMEDDISKLLEASFEILRIDIYEEFEKDDSFLILARKKD
jgi:trans-aconitate methyltransferase